MYQPVTRKNLWFERLMATIASIGFLLAMFDLTYIPWRDFYFKYIPQITRFYDPYKGIEPHRETQRYLDAVTQLKSVVNTTGLNSAAAQSWLEDLTALSIETIQDNPFQVAGKTGNLERIKNEVRDRTGNQSAKGAFRIFWSQAYLTKSGWAKEIAFYDRAIEPLMVTNYYRKLDLSGHFIDRFWEIDLIFIGIFAGEAIGRNFYIRRHNRRASWQQAIIWRWYDFFLILPAVRWLRIIPVMVRWHQAELINLDLVRIEINRLIVGQAIDDLTDAVVVQVLQKTQIAIKQGKIIKFIGSYINGPHIDLNSINEMEAIVELMLELVVFRIVPKIQPDLEAIFKHILQQALAESPAYRNFRSLPGIGKLPTQAIDRLVQELSESIYLALTKIIADPERSKLSERLAINLTQAIGDELERGPTIVKIESLLYDLLEEIKITYVHKLARENGKL